MTSDNSESFVRQTVQDNEDQQQSADDVNRAMRMIEVDEHYIRLNLEEDDVARRYKITTIGTGYEIVDIEEVTDWPLASGTPIIMPHRLFGRSLADLVVDIQQIKTSLLRATLNNAYYANNQRVEVSETHASENTIDDLLNNRVGGIVRTKMPGGLNQLQTQSIGNWVLPVVEYMDGVMETRTGVSKATQSFDVDDMNHARTGAVSRLMDASEMRVKLIARVFAETFLVDLFRGIHQLCQEYSEEAEEVQLNKTWVQVDPREWKKREHMTVGLPLGGASRQQLLGFYAQMLGVQKEALMLPPGQNGPMVTPANIFQSLDHMARLAGLKGAAPYFNNPGAPSPNYQPPPDPKMVAAQAKAQQDAASNQQDMQLDAERQQFEQRMALQKQQSDMQREQAEFAHKTALEKMRFQMETQLTQMKEAFDAHLAALKASRDADRQDRLADAKAAAARSASTE